jgi:hypothetical protein
MYLTFSVLFFSATLNGQRIELCCEYCSDVDAFFYFTLAEKMWWESSWIAILFYYEFCFTVCLFCFCFRFCKLVNFASAGMIEFYFPIRLFCFCFCFCKLVNFAFVGVTVKPRFLFKLVELSFYGLICLPSSV